MAGQDNLHIAREIFAAWNAHDVEGFIKRLDTKTMWESDVFPAPFSGHEGARQPPGAGLSPAPDLPPGVGVSLPTLRRRRPSNRP